MNLTKCGNLNHLQSILQEISKSKHEFISNLQFKNLNLSIFSLNVHGMDLDFSVQDSTGKEIKGSTEMDSAGGDGNEFVISALAETINVDQILKIVDFIIISKLKLLEIVTLSEPNQPIKCLEFRVISDLKVDLEQKILFLAREIKIDLGIQLNDVYRKNKRLVVFDMDSTLIQQEVIDELAREFNVYHQIAPITEAAMRGEIDFNESLKRRVGLLKNAPCSIIDSVKNRIQFTNGALELCKFLKKMGYVLAVVSDYAFANTLEQVDDILTGNVLGEIVNGPRKADLLSVIAQKHGIQKNQIIAVGDGANDLFMMKKAGLSVAFNAKPKVQEQAMMRINQPSLLNLLYILGFDWKEQETVLKSL